MFSHLNPFRPYGDLLAPPKSSISQNAVLKNLTKLVQIPEIQTFIQDADYAFYQKMINFLVPEVRSRLLLNLLLLMRFHNNNCVF